MRSAHFLLVGLVSVTIAAAVWRRGEAVGPLITGPAIVADGDSLSIGESRVRLAGIDAPELGQRCTAPHNVEWACGLEAKRELERRIGEGAVSCRQLRIDPYDRIIAVCTTLNGIDLSAEMARSGYALADGRDSRYIQDERSARTGGKGIWSGSFQTPWEWRAQELEREDRCC